MFYNAQVIPSVAKMKGFEAFLKTGYEACFVMDMHVSLLQGMIEKAHQKKKKVIIHLDMIHGLSTDEYGCEYACQVLKVDGIISTKGKVLETAKKNKKMAILRLFLIDSKSLDKGIKLANELKPDYLEILPAIAYSIVPKIQSKTKVKLIGGGLVTESKSLRKALDAGYEAISTSNQELWDDCLQVF